MKIVYTDSFIKDFKKVKDKLTREKILKVIIKLSKFPKIGKPLRYNLKNYRGLRINPYRLIYSLREGKIYLHTFEHRKSVYK